MLSPARFGWPCAWRTLLEATTIWHGPFLILLPPEFAGELEGTAGRHDAAVECSDECNAGLKSIRLYFLLSLLYD